MSLRHLPEPSIVRVKWTPRNGKRGSGSRFAGSKILISGPQPPIMADIGSRFEVQVSMTLQWVEKRRRL